MAKENYEFASVSSRPLEKAPDPITLDFFIISLKIVLIFISYYLPDSYSSISQYMLQRQNLINVIITMISNIHASLKGNYKSILKKLHAQVFIKSIKKIRENIRKSV